MASRPEYYNTQNIDIAAFLAIHNIEPLSCHRMIGSGKVEFTYSNTPELTEIVMLFSSGTAICNAVTLLNARQRCYKMAREARGH